MNSSLFSKRVSRSHITEQRFMAYSKANNYIKHLFSSYDHKKDILYDESSVLHQLFKSQTPVNTNHKRSIMPKSSVSNEFEQKIKLLNAFHNPSEKKVKKISHMEKKSSTQTRRPRNTYFSTKKYKSLLKKLSNDADFMEKSGESNFKTTESGYVRRFEELLKDKQRTRSQNKGFFLKRESKKLISASPKHGSPKMMVFDYNIELDEGSSVFNSTMFPRLKTLSTKKERFLRMNQNDLLPFKSKKAENLGSKYSIIQYPEYLNSSLKDGNTNT